MIGIFLELKVRLRRENLFASFVVFKLVEIKVAVGA